MGGYKDSIGIHPNESSKWLQDKLRRINDPA